jgi:glutathione synthase/RimK-type ligase-like ATP-grasp enzyme
MSTVVVVDNPKRWPLKVSGIEVVSADDYLTQPRFGGAANLKVYNLCRSYGYQTAGYYVSLLAEARGHKPLPSVTTLQDLRLASIHRLAEQELDELIARGLKGVKDEKFELWVYFGASAFEKYQKLAAAMFGVFPAPVLKVTFARDEDDWAIDSMRAMGAGDIPDEDVAWVAEQAERYFARPVRARRSRTPTRYDMAILHRPDDAMPCSNAKALKKFVDAADGLGIRAEMVTKEDAGRIAEFDALFIRDTTAVDHYTYRMARRAAAEGMVVIDDPVSILRCTNKVYQHELMTRHRLPTPKTVIFGEDTAGLVGEQIGFPAVIKQPDSSFSAGVIKIDSPADFAERIPAMLEDSELLLAQEFCPTEFDWRVGVLGGQPLFVVKYYMARKHWQIVKRDEKGVHAGNFEALPVEAAPSAVVRLAVRAAKLIGDGLYGVDLKVIDAKPRIIEINDNPNIDAGIEDKVLGDALYERVMWHFLRALESGRR